MRWQHRSVQFKAPQFFSWKIPSSDQQRDTTMPFAALDEVSFRRDAIADVNVEAHVHFTLYLKDIVPMVRP